MMLQCCQIDKDFETAEAVMFRTLVDPVQVLPKTMSCIADDKGGINWGYPLETCDAW